RPPAYGKEVRIMRLRTLLPGLLALLFISSNAIATQYHCGGLLDLKVDNFILHIHVKSYTADGIGCGISSADLKLNGELWKAFGGNPCAGAACDAVTDVDLSCWDPGSYVVELDAGCNYQPGPDPYIGCLSVPGP